MGAGAVRDRARADDPLPRLDALDVRTDLHDDAGELVPEDGRIVEAALILSQSFGGDRIQPARPLGQR